MRRTPIARAPIAALGLAATLSLPAEAEPIEVDLAQSAEAAALVGAAFRRGEETISVAFEAGPTPEALIEDAALGPWISRVEKTPDHVAALCEISLRRGLTPGQQIAQLAVSSTQNTGATDPYAPAAGYDAFIFFGETRTKKQKVVRLIFTKRAAHGAYATFCSARNLDCIALPFLQSDLSIDIVDTGRSNEII